MNPRITLSAAVICIALFVAASVSATEIKSIGGFSYVEQNGVILGAPLFNAQSPKTTKKQ